MSDVSTRVKICGLTRLDDAELAVELGAWAIGMVFYPGSPRNCSLAEAQRIAAVLRRRVELCGVFVNASLEQIVSTAEEASLTLLQLHGDEGPAFCGELARRTGARIVKAAQVGGPGDVRDLGRFHVDFHLLDARSRQPGKEHMRGGTGETFDWALLAGRRSKVPLILSGGLSSANVTEAIERVRPFAVDTASGTESSPGHKDPAKLGEFFAAVERAAFNPPTEPGQVPGSISPIEAASSPIEAASPGVPAQTSEPSAEGTRSIGLPA
jgi:phosphoribosylanthranilate isomerase